MKKQHIVFDLETLGCSSKAVIATIGARRIVQNDQGEWILADSYYRRVDLNQPGREFDAETITFWFHQSPAVQIEIYGGQSRTPNEPTTRPDLSTVLKDFKTWALIYNATNLYDTIGLWSRGSSFDLTLLRDAYGGPFNAWRKWAAERDVRTAEMLVGPPDWTTIEKHNALNDADLEADSVVRYLNLIEILKSTPTTQAYAG